jgi:hypothetical protein
MAGGAEREADADPLVGHRRKKKKKKTKKKKKILGLSYAVCIF